MNTLSLGEEKVHFGKEQQNEKGKFTNKQSSTNFKFGILDSNEMMFNLVLLFVFVYIN